MNRRDHIDRVARLEREGVPFALATVVVRRAPVSAHLGDRAIVLADGTMEGFVGGSCSRDIVRRQGLDAIRTGNARLLRIRPDLRDNVADQTGETVVVPMSCASEGAVDVYIEPHLPPRLLLIAGHTPVADALWKLASCLEAYRVVRVVAADESRDIARGDDRDLVCVDGLAAYLDGLDPATRARAVAVVGSQGHYDEATLGALLAGDPPAFVGLLASRKRAATVFGVLAQDGITAERIAAIRNPVGLAIEARSPDDVAISILAQVVEASAVVARTTPPPEPAASAIDPICGMEVEIAGASHRAEHDGTTYYFCCAHCRATFAADPARFVGSSAQT